MNRVSPRRLTSHRLHAVATGVALTALLTSCQQAASPPDVIETLATFTVNSTSDAHDANPGNGRCETAPGNGVCTLRAAIEEANARTAYPTDIITLPAGSYKLTLGELVIQDSLYLHGASSRSTVIDGDNRSRVLVIQKVSADPTVHISKVKVQKGSGGSFQNGGGMFVSSGSYLFLSNSVVTNNKGSQFGGGISNAGYLQLFRTRVSNNSVPLGAGGGQTASGGGIFSFASGITKIERSTISGNEATRGGGIRNGGGRLEVVNSTISGNRAVTRGGGIMSHGITVISSSTITNNQANLSGYGTSSEVSFGGGIYNTGTVSIGKTILAGNLDNRSSFDSNYAPDCYSKATPELPSVYMTSHRSNLVGVVNGNCNFRDSIWGDPVFDFVGTASAPLNARLSPLGGYGGGTPTHALLSGSPAIDKATSGTSASFFDRPSKDQRGKTRPRDGDGNGSAQCDIGSFER